MSSLVFKLTGNQTGANLILNQVIMIFGENLLLVWVALKMLGANRTPPLNKKKNEVVTVLSFHCHVNK